MEIYKSVSTKFLSQLCYVAIYYANILHFWFARELLKITVTEKCKKSTVML